MIKFKHLQINQILALNNPEVDLLLKKSNQINSFIFMIKNSHLTVKKGNFYYKR